VKEGGKHNARHTQSESGYEEKMWERKS